MVYIYEHFASVVTWCSDHVLRKTETVHFPCNWRSTTTDTAAVLLSIAVGVGWCCVANITEVIVRIEVGEENKTETPSTAVGVLLRFGGWLWL